MKWEAYTSRILHTKMLAFLENLPEETRIELEEIIGDFSYECYCIGLEDGEVAEEDRKTDAWEKNHCY